MGVISKVWFGILSWIKTKIKFFYENRKLTNQGRTTKHSTLIFSHISAVTFLFLSFIDFGTFDVSYVFVTGT